MLNTAYSAFASSYLINHVNKHNKHLLSDSVIVGSTGPLFVMTHTSWLRKAKSMSYVN